jgi:hypothetical protein
VVLLKSPKIEVVNGNDQHACLEIRRIHRSFYTGDEERYLEESAYLNLILPDPRTIKVVLKNGTNNDKIVGYMMGIPQDVAHEIWKDWDPQLRKDSSALYVDDIELQGFESPLEFARVIRTLTKEANRRGFFKFSFHSRTSITEKLVHVLSRILNLKPGINVKHQVLGDWYGPPEMYFYVEGEVE